MFVFYLGLVYPSPVWVSQMPILFHILHLLFIIVYLSPLWAWQNDEFASYEYLTWF